MRTIDIGVDFTQNPGGRTPNDGDGNGTSFREKFLLPVLRDNEKAIVILDNVIAYPASFLDEAFGGLVLKEGYEPEVVLNSFKFQAKKQGFFVFEDAIKTYIERAGIEKKRSEGN